MKVLKFTSLVFILLIFLFSNVIANTLAKKHQLEVKLGMWAQTNNIRTDVSMTDVSTSVGSNGFLGSVSYSYFIKENIALNFSAGLMNANVNVEASIGSVSAAESKVLFALVGGKYYFPKSTYNKNIRPYLKAAVGNFSGSQSGTQIVFLSVNDISRTKNAIGSHIGGGVEYFISHRILAGISLGYNFMADFDKPIGGSDNYSGPEFSFCISALLGKGK